jgi:hypothetical protein
LTPNTHGTITDKYDYYRVDYSVLGFELLTLEQWQGEQSGRMINNK